MPLERTGHRQHDVPKYYLQAAKFPGLTAHEVYPQIRETLQEGESNLSAFQFQLFREWHIAVFGNEFPKTSLDRQIRSILAAGEPVDLPIPVIAKFQLLRAQEVLKQQRNSPGRQ